MLQWAQAEEEYWKDQQEMWFGISKEKRLSDSQNPHGIQWSPGLERKQEFLMNDQNGGKLEKQLVLKQDDKKSSSNIGRKIQGIKCYRS